MNAELSAGVGSVTVGWGIELSEAPGKKAELWLLMGSILGSTTEAESGTGASNCLESPGDTGHKSQKEAVT